MSKALILKKTNRMGLSGAEQIDQRRSAERLRVALKRPQRPGFRSETGQAIVELAIVLPVLLLIILGILDFGRAINDWNDETHVANLAARYAAVGTLPTSGKCGTAQQGSGETLSQFVSCEVGIDSPALQSGSRGGNGPQAVTTTVCVPTNTQFQSVQVNVTTQYQWIPYIGLTSTSNPVSGSATQEIEAPTGVPSGWITATTC